MQALHGQKQATVKRGLGSKISPFSDGDPSEWPYLYVCMYKLKEPNKKRNAKHAPSVTHHQHITPHPLEEYACEWDPVAEIPPISMEHDDGRSARDELATQSVPVPARQGKEKITDLILRHLLGDVHERRPRFQLLLLR